MTTLFYTKRKEEIPGISKAIYQETITRLHNEFGLSWGQTCEAAAFSMAMVIRYALGLSSAGGRSTIIASDCPSGWVALATMRHLLNGGALSVLFIMMKEGVPSAELSQQLYTLEKMGVTPIICDPNSVSQDFIDVVPETHNVICGLYGSENDYSEYVDIMNDGSIPVHAIQSPLGVDVDSGASKGNPLFASSTLSLGLPFAGLHKGNDYVGRHYVCDISIPYALLEAQPAISPIDSIPLIFSEQPVQQIYTESP